MMICAAIDGLCEKYGRLPHELMDLDPAQMALAYTVATRAAAAWQSL